MLSRTDVTPGSDNSVRYKRNTCLQYALTDYVLTTGVSLFTCLRHDSTLTSRRTSFHNKIHTMASKRSFSDLSSWMHLHTLLYCFDQAQKLHFCHTDIPTYYDKINIDIAVQFLLKMSVLT